MISNIKFIDIKVFVVYNASDWPCTFTARLCLVYLYTVTIITYPKCILKDRAFIKCLDILCMNNI